MFNTGMISVSGSWKRNAVTLGAPRDDNGEFLGRSEFGGKKLNLESLREKIKEI